MSRTRKWLYGIWAAITLVAVLFGWIQTTRLTAVSQERQRIRSECLTTLLGQAERMLDYASEQAGARNLGNAEANANAAVALLESARRAALEDSSKRIAESLKAVRKVRGDIIQGDEKRSANGDLKREAANVRALMKGI